MLFSHILVLMYTSEVACYVSKISLGISYFMRRTIYFVIKCSKSIRGKHFYNFNNFISCNPDRCVSRVKKYEFLCLEFVTNYARNEKMLTSLIKRTKSLVGIGESPVANKITVMEHNPTKSTVNNQLETGTVCKNNNNLRENVYGK